MCTSIYAVRITSNRAPIFTKTTHLAKKLIRDCFDLLRHLALLPQMFALTWNLLTPTLIRSASFAPEFCSKKPRVTAIMNLNTRDIKEKKKQYTLMIFMIGHTNPFNIYIYIYIY